MCHLQFTIPRINSQRPTILLYFYGILAIALFFLLIVLDANGLLSVHLLWICIQCYHTRYISRPINIIHPLRILNKSHPRQSARKVSSTSIRQNEGLLSCVNTVLLYFPRRSSGHDVIRIEARPLSMLTLSTWPRRVRHSSSDSLDRRTVDADSSACILVRANCGSESLKREGFASCLGLLDSSSRVLKRYNQVC